MPLGSITNQILEFVPFSGSIQAPGQGTYNNVNIEITMRASPYVVTHNVQESLHGTELFNGFNNPSIVGNLVAWDEEICVSKETANSNWSWAPSFSACSQYGVWYYFGTQTNSTIQASLPWCLANSGRAFATRPASVYNYVTTGPVTNLNLFGYDSSMFDFISTDGNPLKNTFVWPFVSIETNGLWQSGFGQPIYANMPQFNLASDGQTCTMLVTHVPTYYARAWIVDPIPSSAQYTVFVDVTNSLTQQTTTITLSPSTQSGSTTDTFVSAQVLEVFSPVGLDTPNLAGALIQLCDPNHPKCNLPIDTSAPTFVGGVYIPNPSISYELPQDWVWMPPELAQPECPGGLRNFVEDEAAELWQWVYAWTDPTLGYNPVLYNMCKMNNSAALLAANVNADINDAPIPFLPGGYSYKQDGRNMWLTQAGFVHQQSNNLFARVLLQINEQLYADVEECASATLGETTATIYTQQNTGTVVTNLCNTQAIDGSYTISVSCIPTLSGIPAGVFVVSPASASVIQPNGNCNPYSFNLILTPTDPPDPTGTCNVTVYGCPGNTFYGFRLVPIVYQDFIAPPPGPPPPQPPVNPGGCTELSDLFANAICNLSYSMSPSLAPVVVVLFTAFLSTGTILFAFGWILIAFLIAWVTANRFLAKATAIVRSR